MVAVGKRVVLPRTSTGRGRGGGAGERESGNTVFLALYQSGVFETTLSQKISRLGLKCPETHQFQNHPFPMLLTLVPIKTIPFSLKTIQNLQPSNAQPHATTHPLGKEY